MKEGLGRAVESFSCEWVSSYEWVLSWLRVLRHFSSCSYVWFLREFAGVVYVSSYFDLLACTWPCLFKAAISC